jgi:hypothetical protein
MEATCFQMSHALVMEEEGRILVVKATMSWLASVKPKNAKSFRVFPALKAMCVESQLQGWWNIEKEVLRFQHNDQDSILKLDKKRIATSLEIVEESRIFFRKPMREVPNCIIEN